MYNNSIIFITSELRAVFKVYKKASGFYILRIRQIKIFKANIFGQKGLRCCDTIRRFCRGLVLI